MHLRKTKITFSVVIFFLIIGFLIQKFDIAISSIIPENIMEKIMLVVFLINAIILLPLKLLFPNIFSSSENGFIIPIPYSGWIIAIIFYTLLFFLVTLFLKRNYKLDSDASIYKSLTS